MPGRRTCKHAMAHQHFLWGEHTRHADVPADIHGASHARITGQHNAVCVRTFPSDADTTRVTYTTPPSDTWCDTNTPEDTHKSHLGFHTLDHTLSTQGTLIDKYDIGIVSVT